MEEDGGARGGRLHADRGAAADDDADDANVFGTAIRASDVAILVTIEACSAAAVSAAVDGAADGSDNDDDDDKGNNVSPA